MRELGALVNHPLEKKGAGERRSLVVQLRDEVRQLLRAEALSPGDLLPTEAALAERFGVSRPTVREAFKLLEQDGLVRCRQGLGRFLTIAPPLDRPLTRLEGVTEMLASRGCKPVNQVLAVSVALANTTEREQLMLPPDVPLIHLERARYHEDTLLVYSVDVLPRALVKGEIDSVDWSGSLFAVLDAQSSPVHHASTRIEAGRVDARIARRLSVLHAEPWLILTQVHFTEDGRPVLLSVDYHRSGHFAFHLIRRRDG